MITNNEGNMIKNIIDQSGLMILPITKLKELIQITTGRDNVEIEFIDDNSCGCLSSPKYYILQRKIKDVIVDGYDFDIGFNRIYTLFGRYRISIDKVCA